MEDVHVSKVDIPAVRNCCPDTQHHFVQAGLPPKVKNNIIIYCVNCGATLVVPVGTL